MNSALLITLLTSFLLPLLSSPCPLALFTCEGQYSNTDVTICSNHKVQCMKSVLWVQFYGRGLWYETGHVLFPEKTFKVFDPTLGSQLQQKGCDFLYYFTNPIHGFYPSRIPAQIKNLTMFNCTTGSYDFSRDLFREKYSCSYCGSYHLYYSYNPGNKEPSYSKNCSRQGRPMVEWELAFSESPSGFVDFSLVSVAFVHNRTSNPECFSCMIREGKCSSINGGSSECRCQLDCKIGSQRLKRKLLIAFGSLVGGFLLALGVVFLWLRRKNGNTRSVSRKALVRSVSTDPSPLDRDLEAFGSLYRTFIFTYEELQEATGGFDSSKELGDGGFGVVYKGLLKDGRVVAVKRLHERNYRRVQQFRNEVEILNRIRHPNLVSLYGCTTRDSRELLLVYEYVPNGTLADHLNGPLASENLLTWPRRLSIAVETAAALAYLHATQPQIIHRDVKTSNILLDDAFHVKVADFGLSRLFPSGRATHVSTAPQGTPGYVDPEYHQCYQLTDKSDVYSFGVVLVELISSKPAVDIDRPRSEINLSNIAMAKIPRGLVHELVDPTLGYDTNPGVKRTIDAVAELAFRCLQPEKDMRPSMDEVRDTLVQIHGGDQRKVSPEGEYQTRDDASLLKSSESAAFSPVTVIGNWASISTTHSASP